MRFRTGIFALLLAALLVVALGNLAAVRALQFTGGDRVVIGPDEVVSDDLYVAGREVVIHGTVAGDVYAAAQRVLIRANARIAGDLVAGAQIVDVQGVVEDDVRAAGYIVRIASPQVGDDVVAAGFSVEVSSGTTVGGSLVAGAYQVYMGGRTGEDMLVGANGILIEGEVGGNVTANVGERGGPPPAVWASFLNTQEIAIPAVPSGLTVGSGARIGGTLVYQAVQAASIAPEAEIRGRVTHRLPPPPVEEERPPEFGSRPWVFDQVRRLVTYLLVGIVIFLGVPQTGRRFGRLVWRRPLAALGWGVITVAVTIAILIFVLLAAILTAIVLALVTLDTLMKWVLVIGFLTDVLVIVGYLAYTGLVIPSLVPYAVLSPLDRGGKWWLLPLILGVSAYLVLASLPYIGWLIALVVVLLGLGGGVLLYRHRHELTEQHA